MNGGSTQCSIDINVDNRVSSNHNEKLLDYTMSSDNSSDSSDSTDRSTEQSVMSLRNTTCSGTTSSLTALNIQSPVNDSTHSNSTHINSTYGKSPYTKSDKESFNHPENESFNQGLKGSKFRRTTSVSNLAQMIVSVLIEIYLFFRKR